MKNVENENKKLGEALEIIEQIKNENTKETEKKEKANQKLIVPDTSILIQGKLSQMIKDGKLADAKIIIPVMVLDELQAQASRGKEIGFEGLQEIKKIRDAGKNKGIAISFTGRRPTMEEINLAKKGRIDALIRDVASEKRATLLTSDYVQALVAEVEGISVEYIPQPLRESKLVLEDFFTVDTQSVHLKEGAIPLAKRGKPGEIKLVRLRDTPMEEDELKKMIDQIVLKARSSDDGFVEMSNYGSLIIQLGNYRISIARPPFADATEITAVRPIAKVNLSDYKLHADLEKMLTDQSVGVLISGPPGSGKSTFAASIADLLVKNDKIVKTFEQPRDLQVGPEVTQYAPLEGDWEKTSEILLLVRPDYTIFDEVRRTKDFRIFADMRMAGVGMIGVMHATDPISSIQRFIGRVELGVIPHVIDVVIFIKNGKVEKVYEIALTVKVPHGMTEADLARPVVEVRDFETKKPEYEIYSYGEENVVIPIGETKAKSAIKELAKQAILHEIKRFDHSPDIEILSDNDITIRVRNDVIPAIIGKGGATVEGLEKKLGLHINIEPKEKTLKHPVSFIYEETGGRFNLLVDDQLTGEQVDIYSGEEFLLSPMVGKEGKISIKKNSDLGTKVLQALASKRLKIVA